jgi:hypothetical protein
MPHVVYPTRKDEIVERATAPREPSQQGLARFGHQFKLHGPMRLLLDHSRASSQGSTSHNRADFHFNDVAAAQFAIDRQVEQRSVAQPSVLIEEKTDCPDIAGFKRALGTDDVTCILRTTPICVRVKIRYSHDNTPSAILAKGILRPRGKDEVDIVRAKFQVIRQMGSF